MFSNNFNSKGVKNAKKRLDSSHNTVSKKVSSLGLPEDDVKTINSILEKNHKVKFLDLMTRAANGELTDAETADLNEEENNEDDLKPTPAPVSNPSLPESIKDSSLDFLGADPGDTGAQLKATNSKTSNKKKR